VAEDTEEQGSGSQRPLSFSSGESSRRAQTVRIGRLKQVGSRKGAQIAPRIIVVFCGFAPSREIGFYQTL
jgi:hypothetical protein